MKEGAVILMSWFSGEKKVNKQIGTKNIPAQVLEQYEHEEQEFIIVTGEMSASAGHIPGSDWTASLAYLGCVSVKDGTVTAAKGYMSWVLTEEEEKSRVYFQYFDKNTIYKIKGRRPKPLKDPKKNTDFYMNRIYVSEILEKDVQNKELADLLAEYQKEVSIESAVFGKLILNKDFGLYEGTGKWCGNTACVSLEVIDENETIAGRDLLEQFFEKAQDWDEKMRRAAAKELTSLANDWKNDDEELAETQDITEADFAERIGISSIDITTEGDFTVYYDDDDMFAGHVICIFGNIASGIDDVQMQG